MSQAFIPGTIGSPTNWSTPWGGQVTTSVNALARYVNNPLVAQIPGGVVNVRAWPFNVAGDGKTDDAEALEKAIAAAAGGTAWIPPGKYKLSRPVNILSKVHVLAPRKLVEIIMATPNVDGFVIGDGTDPTRNACFNTVIEGLTFVPGDGVTASTMGSCIFRNYVGLVHIQDCYFYGADSGGKKLWNGTTDYACDSCNILNCDYTQFQNYGHNTGGTTYPKQTIGGRFDYCQWTECDVACLYIGQYSQGLTCNFPIIYSFDGWGIHINAVAATAGLNFFFSQADVECSTGLGSVYVEDAQMAQFVGGWLSGNNAFKSGPNGSAHSLIGVQMDQSTLDIAAPATTISGCSIQGDLSTQNIGITVRSTAVDFALSGGRVGQYLQNGVKLIGKPPGAKIDTTFKAIAGAEVATDTAYAVADRPPKISGSSDQARSLTAATSVTVSPVHNFVQITGGTPVEAITYLGIDALLTVQAGAGGIDLVNGPTLSLKGAANATVPAGATIQFMSIGTGALLEVGRAF